jgi:hypothetical protein
LEYGRLDGPASTFLQFLPNFAETWVSHCQVVKILLMIIDGVSE